MGEVYRAHDGRLGRDVALKVLRSEVTPDQVERLGREARAAGSLNHPNIVAVFDVGLHEGVPYVVSELLEGRSLGQRLLESRLSYRRALEYGIQIAQALGAAHAKGICHRDVKPENVFITSDGRVKLLDFGLVKLQEPTVSPGSEDPTAEHTGGGMLQGTPAYMSPEQAVGGPVDERTDLFSLGLVLYEMFTGARAFRRESTVETIRALLADEPPDPVKLNPDLPPASVDVLRRCLEKNREERFQSARDLAFHLQQLHQGASTASSSDEGRARGLRRRWLVLAALVVAGLVAAGALWPRPVAPRFEQLTFHRGRIGGARFASEGVVYSQTQQGDPLGVWHRLRDSPEPRALGYAADVLAAHGGELALSLRRRFGVGERFFGTLAVAPIGGGAPRELLDDVEDADWDPAGTHLAVARWSGAGGPSRLEYPPGQLLYETSGSIHYVRMSRDGRRVAFLEDKGGSGIGGRVAVVEVGGGRGGRKFLTDEFPNARGLAWSPRGEEVWFTAAEGRTNRALRAVDLQGRTRLVLGAPGSLTLWDTASDGRVLLARDDERRAVVGVPPGETGERDLSWFDTSGLADLSADGRKLLIGDRFGIYLRGTDGTAPVYLGLKEGYADDLSPDGRFALAETSTKSELMLLPTGTGDPRPLPAGNIATYGGAMWFPDGRRIIVNGKEPGRSPRAYVQDLPDGRPRPFTPESTWALSISSDGRSVAAIGQGQGISVWPAEGGPARHVPGSEPGDRPVAFSADGRSLWVFRRGEVPVHVFRVEIDSGRRTLWKTLVPPDPAGVYTITNFKVTPTGDAYFYGYARILSELYVVSGLR
jgi:eukaryotic-like serine/threonine-protein kinase